MKKIMSALLGLSLVLGTASLSFGQQDTTKSKKSKKGKKKGTGDTTKTSR
jgi:hypothetical protein